jgi:hypothetical protein
MPIYRAQMPIYRAQMPIYRAQVSPANTHHHHKDWCCPDIHHQETGGKTPLHQCAEKAKPYELAKGNILPAMD